NQLNREQGQSDNVRRVGDEQNRRQQALRLLEQAVQLQRGRYAALHILPQPHWIDRKQSAFYPVKEKRNDPAKNNNGDRDAHFATANPSCCGPTPRTRLWFSPAGLLRFSCARPDAP